MLLHAILSCLLDTPDGSRTFDDASLQVLPTHRHVANAIPVGGTRIRRRNVMMAVYLIPIGLQHALGLWSVWWGDFGC